MIDLDEIEEPGIYRPHMYGLKDDLPMGNDVDTTEGLYRSRELAVWRTKVLFRGEPAYAYTVASPDEDMPGWEIDHIFERKP